MADDDEVRITLRLPTELRDALKETIEDTGRSMNAEIVARLVQSFDPESSGPARLKAYEEIFERNDEERTKLIEALNNQDLILRKMVEVHRTLTIMARTIGEVILEGGDPHVIQTLAAGLSQIEMDLSSDASEKIPKQPWE